MKYLFIAALVSFSLSYSARADDEADLLQEESKTKSEVESIDAAVNKVQKDIQDTNARVAKLRGEVATLQQLRDEKNKKLLDLGAQNDAAHLELKELEHQRTQAEADLNQAKEDEKAFLEKSKKSNAEMAQKKAQMEKDIAQAQQETARIRGSIVTPPPAPKIEAPPPRGPAAAMEGEMVLLKDCKYYASPTKHPQVLGSRPMGSSVHKVAEGNNWIAFQVTDSQKGYLLKSCFGN